VGDGAALAGGPPSPLRAGVARGVK
jgi:hypothetical protein